jgi:hypothetical protein
MRRVMVRYRVKPEQTERNAELVRAVYAQLQDEQTPGIRYSTMRLEDGVTFVHLAETEAGKNPLAALDASRSSSARSRCAATSRRSSPRWR